MAIPKGHRANFNALLRAFREDAVALMECLNNEDEPVYVICAVERPENGDYTFVPFAKMFDGNPYEEVTPPIAE